MDPKKKLLMIDDNPADVRALEEILRQYAEGEFEMLFETSLRGALERLGREKVDLVLLDMFLPDSIGLETLEKVKKTYAQGPIVVLTGLYDQEMAFRGLQMGARCYLNKGGLEGGESLLKALRGFIGTVQVNPEQGGN